MPEFDGPLALLLSLIEARQLDVLTVPLGALADAYLDALGRLEADRLGNVSSFVTIASQLILIKSRAMLPRRTDPTDPLALADEGVDPEAELRARLLIYRAHRDAGLRLAEDALRRIGSFRREPSVARAAALAGARPVDAPPLDPRRLVAGAGPAGRDRRAARAAARDHGPRRSRITERAEIIRAALRDAPRVVLQDLLTGVRDRVVIAITFLAMLELMKRREIVVEQATPWGPIVARETTADERAAAGVAAAPRRPDRRVAGVVRMTDAVEPIEVPSTEDASGEPAGDGPSPRMARRPSTPPPAPGRRRRPGPDRADRGGPRGPAVRRREAALPPRDRGPRRHGPGDRRRPSRRPRGVAAGSGHPAADRWRPGRAGDGFGGRRARRALHRRGRRPAVAGLARDPRDRRLPPAGHEGRHRADPRRRFGLHHPDAAPSPVRGRARPVRRSRPAVPVRHRLRVPRTVRADEPRRAAAARRRRGRAAGRGGWGTGHRAAVPDRRRRPTDGRRAAPEGPRRIGRRVAAGERGPHRQRPGHGGRQARPARHAGRSRHGDHRRRRPGHRRRRRARIPAAAQAGRRDLHGSRPPRLEDRPRHDPDRAAPRGRTAVPGRPARPGLRGPARPDQRRRLGRPRAAPAPRHRARVRDRPAGAA